MDLVKQRWEFKLHDPVDFLLERQRAHRPCKTKTFVPAWN